MIKKNFTYLGKHVEMEAYNHGGLKVANQFLQDYIFEPFEKMKNGQELKFLYKLFNNGKDCIHVTGLTVDKARKYTYVQIFLNYGNWLAGYDNFRNEIRLKFEK